MLLIKVGLKIFYERYGVEAAFKKKEILVLFEQHVRNRFQNVYFYTQTYCSSKIEKVLIKKLNMLQGCGHCLNLYLNICDKIKTRICSKRLIKNSVSIYLYS